MGGTTRGSTTGSWPCSWRWPCSRAAVPTRRTPARPADRKGAGIERRRATPPVPGRTTGPGGSPTLRRTPASTSCTSTACPGSSISPRSCPPASGCWTSTTTATSTSTSYRDSCWGRGTTIDEALFPPRGPPPLTGRLYRNDLVAQADGTRTLRFTDVTDESGIDARGYGMGVATGDVDNDGLVDLYLTNLGANQLFRNNGDGTFSDVSRRSGLDDPGWERVGRVRGLRPRWMAGPLRGELRRLRHRSGPGMPQRDGAGRLLCSTGVSGPARPALSEPGRRQLRRRHGHRPDADNVRAGPRRGDRRLRRRRVAGHLRRQRR